MHRIHNISNLSPLQLDMKKAHELMFGAILRKNSKIGDMWHVQENKDKLDYITN